MNGIEYLIRDHARHRSLFKKTAHDRKHYSELRKEIIHHVNIEESILYPRLLEFEIFEPNVRVAWEEHNLIMKLLQELDDDQFTEETWMAKFSVLEKILYAHMKEEEDHIFPKVVAKSTPAYLAEVGEQFKVQEIMENTEDILYPDAPGSHQLK